MSSQIFIRSGQSRIANAHQGNVLGTSSAILGQDVSSSMHHTSSVDSNRQCIQQKSLSRNTCKESDSSFDIESNANQARPININWGQPKSPNVHQFEQKAEFAQYQSKQNICKIKPNHHQPQQPQKSDSQKQSQSNLPIQTNLSLKKQDKQLKSQQPFQTPQQKPVPSQQIPKEESSDNLKKLFDDLKKQTSAQSVQIKNLNESNKALRQMSQKLHKRVSQVDQQCTKLRKKIEQIQGKYIQNKAQSNKQKIENLESKDRVQNANNSIKNEVSASAIEQQIKQTEQKIKQMFTYTVNKQGINMSLTFPLQTESNTKLEWSINNFKKLTTSLSAQIVKYTTVTKEGIKDFQRKPGEVSSEIKDPSQQIQYHNELITDENKNKNQKCQS